MTSAVLILGAGRSSSFLISYLLDCAEQFGFKVIIGDVAIAAATEKAAGRGEAIQFDIRDTGASRVALRRADIVVSLLPPHFHLLVARLCLEQGKHLLTASYVTEEMQALNTNAKEKNLLFLNECGLDPGIDHMSAMHVIDRIRMQGGIVKSFETFTGGLLDPKTDPLNPWRYKFTWNPRNVVMAGQGTAKFLENGKYKYIPYHQLFKHLTAVTLPGLDPYEGYINRDSLKYREAYGLYGIETMIRGTLRNKGYCHAWDVLVQLGCTDDTFEMEAVDTMTHRDFINAFLQDAPGSDVEEKLAAQLNLTIDGDAMIRLSWSGFFENEPIGLTHGSPAQVLEFILDKKWKLRPEDKDQVVMWHRFVYEHDGKKKEIQSTLVATGENSTYTAMAKTVGLPLAIAANLLLQGKIKARGVVIPTAEEIYEPVLKELKLLGITLEEREIG